MVEATESGMLRRLGAGWFLLLASGSSCPGNTETPDIQSQMQQAFGAMTTRVEHASAVRGNLGEATVFRTHNLVQPQSVGVERAPATPRSPRGATRGSNVAIYHSAGREGDIYAPQIGIIRAPDRVNQR